MEAFDLITSDPRACIYACLFFILIEICHVQQAKTMWET